MEQKKSLGSELADCASDIAASTVRETGALAAMSAGAAVAGPVGAIAGLGLYYYGLIEVGNQMDKNNSKS